MRKWPQQSMGIDLFGIWRSQSSAARGYGAAVCAESVESLGLLRWESFAASLEYGIRIEREFRTLTAERHRAPPTHSINRQESGSGPDVVLINGWTLSGRVWPADFIEDLSRTRRVVRMDNRGTGQRQSDRSLFTIAELAADVRAVIEAAGVERPTVVGFSMGGMIATELALRWPGLVGELVLVAARPPSPVLVTSRTGTLLRTLRPPRSDRSLPEQFRERWARLSAPQFAERHPERLDEMASAALAPATPRRTAMAQARAVSAWRGAHRLRKLNVPCTVVHGTLDPLSPAGNSRRLVALIPNARCIGLEGVGHLVPQEAPERLSEIVKAVHEL